MFVLCLHFIKFSNVPSYLSRPILLFFPGLQRENIAQRKQSKLPSHRDLIITRSRAKKMSTSGPSPVEENANDITLLKEQEAKMMHMMQW